MCLLLYIDQGTEPSVPRSTLLEKKQKKEHLKYTRRTSLTRLNTLFTGTLSPTSTWNIFPRLNCCQIKYCKQERLEQS